MTRSKEFRSVVVVLRVVMRARLNIQSPHFGGSPNFTDYVVCASMCAHIYLLGEYPPTMVMVGGVRQLL